MAVCGGRDVVERDVGVHVAAVVRHVKQLCMFSEQKQKQNKTKQKNRHKLR